METDPDQSLEANANDTSQDSNMETEPQDQDEDSGSDILADTAQKSKDVDDHNYESDEASNLSNVVKESLTQVNDDAVSSKAPPRTDIINIVMGSTRASVTTSPNVGKVAAIKTENEEKLDTIDKKRRKSPKPIRKVLVAKKEHDLASTFMKNKRDLLDVLSEEECKFLGENFWIFTVEQLKHALGERLVKSEQGDSNNIYFQIAEKLSSSDIIAKEQEDTKNASKEMDSKSYAEARMKKWAEILDNGKELPRTSMENSFPLTGAISCLLPQAMKNFFSSVPINYVHEFLSLKKTETGAICDLLEAWRNISELPSINKLALAKYLLGLGYRLETALSSIPPPDPMTRKWLNDPIVVMTGAAREFLVEDQGIHTAADFVNTRTKDLAMSLVEWRKAKGMVPLKGSGKVAMISGWKANAKESLEVEQYEGRQLEPSELEAAAEAEFQLGDDDKNTTKRSSKKADSSTPISPRPTPLPLDIVKANKKRTPPEVSRHGQYAMHSKLFLVDVLGQKLADSLESAGYDTAIKLFEADLSSQSPLLHVLQTAEGSHSGNYGKILDGWCQRLYDELLQFAPKSSTSTSEPSKRPRRSVENPAPPTGTRVATPSIRAPIKQETTEEVPHALIQTRSPTYRNTKDAFEALSALTQRFLRSVGITSAEEFLSSRTTDIANEFVTFRVNEGMPELKGLGAIASVSGWKAACRKAAKEMGMSDVADLEPSNKTLVVSVPKSSERPVVSQMSTRKQDRKEIVQADVTESTDDSGIIHKSFAIQNGAGELVSLVLRARRLFRSTCSHLVRMQFRCIVAIQI
jgi:hypothetical protein